MKQMSFSELEFFGKKKKTKRELFLERMEQIVPLNMFCDVIRPYYWVKGNGREPILLEKMVKMYLISQWYNLSDEATEDMIYENQTVRSYVGIDLAYENAPDRSTLGKFRLLLEQNELNKKIFEELNAQFLLNGVIFKEGTIVDATIIDAPSSTQNKDKKRDPEMSSTKKNNTYRFGFKAHIGVDQKDGFIHSMSVTTANIPDICAAVNVLHGEEEAIYGDAGYIGMENREDICEKYKDEKDPQKIIYKDRQNKRHVLDKKHADIVFFINKRRMKIHNMPEGEEKTKLKEEERRKSGIRAKVEYSFRILKTIFHFRKTRLKGLKKNESKLYMLFGLVNLYFLMQKNQISTVKG